MTPKEKAREIAIGKIDDAIGAAVDVEVVEELIKLRAALFDLNWDAFLDLRRGVLLPGQEVSLPEWHPKHLNNRSLRGGA